MIRSATPNDMQALLDLSVAMHAESPRFSKLRLDLDRLAESYETVMRFDGGFAMVAEDGASIVGALLAVVTPHWCSFDLVATDLLCYVLPAHRGTLAAARLIHVYRQWAKRRGAVLINLGVAAGIDTERAAQFYERLGFTRCGVILEA